MTEAQETKIILLMLNVSTLTVPETRNMTGFSEQEIESFFAQLVQEGSLTKVFVYPQRTRYTATPQQRNRLQERLRALILTSE